MIPPTLVVQCTWRRQWQCTILACIFSIALTRSRVIQRHRGHRSLHFHRVVQPRIHQSAHSCIQHYSSSSQDCRKYCTRIQSSHWVQSEDELSCSHPRKHRCHCWRMDSTCLLSHQCTILLPCLRGHITGVTQMDPFVATSCLLNQSCTFYWWYL